MVGVEIAYFEILADFFFLLEHSLNRAFTVSALSGANLHAFNKVIIIINGQQRSALASACRYVWEAGSP